MTITFDNLKPETLRALLADPGTPAELKTKLNNLIAQKGRVELSFAEFVDEKLAAEKEAVS